MVPWWISAFYPLLLSIYFSSKVIFVWLSHLRAGQALASSGSLMDIVHLTPAARFPCYWLFCFALQNFDFRVVAWHISSDTNDFMFLSVLHTSPVPFLICLYTSRQRPQAMKHELSWITWPPSTHYLVNRGPSNHFLKKGLTRYPGFICNFPRPLTSWVLQCMRTWWLKMKTSMIKQQFKNYSSLLIKWKLHLLADKENPKHFVFKMLKRMWKSASIHAPFHF